MKKINELQHNRLYKSAIIAVVLALLSIVLSSLFAIIYTSRFDVFNTNFEAVAILAVSIFGVLISMYGYFYYQAENNLKKIKNLVVIFTSITLTALLAFICMVYLNPYVVPIAIAAILVAVLVDKNIGFIANLTTTLVVLIAAAILNYGIDGGTIFVLESFFGCTVSIIESYMILFMVEKNYSRFKLMYSALAAGVISAILALVLAHIIATQYEYFLMAYAYSLAGTAISVAAFTILIPLYEEMFNVWTDFKLAEACSMARPLLRRLADEAPGTFNHCIIVSNLAESSAIAIGENPSLAKAAGMYHDVGKLMNPEYYIENQEGKYNPHNDLIPKHSARMIISHGSAGYEILKKERLPEEIAIIAKEHHGTTLTSFFYNKAKSITDGMVSDDGYRYDGPKPSSKIAAIVMICDVVEATTRAKQPDNSADLKVIIDNIINDKINDGQFSDSELSFADLDEIKASIIKVIPSIFHKRIDY